MTCGVEGVFWIYVPRYSLRGCEQSWSFGLRVRVIPKKGVDNFLDFGCEFRRELNRINVLAVH